MDTSKIIKGVVNSGRYTVTAPIVKEDYGLYLQIEGVELPSTYEVDFSNSEHNGTSVTMIGNSDGVLIPHQFIDTGKDVFAFLYWVGEDYGKTVYKFRIPNKCRPDRTDDTPTPEEQSVIDQAISALNEAVEQTAQDVIDAAASAQNASADAERAEEARTDAQNYATQAEQSATDAHESASQASASATASAQSAQSAEQTKTEVEDMVEDAQASATASANSARASGEFASQAQGFANDAESSAQSASGYASQARSSSQTASANAQDASTSAQTASQKATEASQSASQALTYKNDAESAKTASQTAQGKAEDAQTAAETAQGKAEDAQEAAESAAASVSASAAQIATNTADIADLQTDVAQNEADILKAFPTDSASGAIASFSDGADDIPLKSLIVNINPVQDLSQGDPSPENICPISGWTGMQLNANGTVIPISWQTEAGTVYGGKLDVLNGVLRVDRQTVSLTDKTFYKHTIEGLFYFANYPVLNIKQPLNGQKTKSACSAYKLVSAVSSISQTPPENGAWMIGRSGVQYVYFRNTAYTEISDFVASLDGVQLVCEMNTPIEIQLTPHEVRSLLGQNNIFADTGDTEVEYRADTKLYIERLTEPDADMIADSNIVSGQYFMVGNSLYKATANIASGAQVIVGTNATRKSLSEALNEINA